MWELLNFSPGAAKKEALRTELRRPGSLDLLKAKCAQAPVGTLRVHPGDVFLNNHLQNESTSEFKPKPKQNQDEKRCERFQFTVPGI